MNNTNKIVIKTAVKSVIIVLAVFIVAFAILCFGFPQHMATFNENIGNYTSAIRYASLRYTYTRDSFDLARCVDDSILSGKAEYVLKYGEEFLSRNDFEEVCLTKTQSIKDYNQGNRQDDQNSDFEFDYKQYVCGKIAVARYIKKDFAGALSLAEQTNGTTSFKKNNALMTLAMEVIKYNDKENAGAVLSAVNEVKPSDENEEALRLNVLSAIEKVLNS